MSEEEMLWHEEQDRLRAASKKLANMHDNLEKHGYPVSDLFVACEGMAGIRVGSMVVINRMTA